DTAPEAPVFTRKSVFFCRSEYGSFRRMLAWSLNFAGNSAGKVLGAIALAGALLTAPAVAQQPIDRPGLSGEDFSALAKRLMPSVVNISTRQTVARGNGLPAFGPNSPLNEFNELLGRGPKGPRRQASLGSGFIIDAAGFIVTNNHVIEGA